MSTTVLRRAQLDEKVRQQIQQRVQKLLQQKKQENGGEKSEGQDNAEEQSKGEDAAEEDNSEGMVYLFDASEHSRSMLAWEGTKKELEEYKKTHELDPSTKIKIIDEGKGKAKPGDKPQQRGPAKPGDKPQPKVKKPEEKVQPKVPQKEEKTQPKPEKEEEKPSVKKEEPKPEGEKFVKKPEEKPAAPLDSSHPKRIPEGIHRQVAIKDSLIDQFGPEAKDWRVHKLNPAQLSYGTKIKFPDGTEKKFGQCSPDERARVEKAINEGLAASKGMKDYTNVSPATFQYNIRTSLAAYDNPEIEEKKNEDQEPVSKENAGKLASSLRDNGRTLLHKYSKSLTSISRPLAESFVDDFANVVTEGLRDGSITGVKQADVDEFLRESVKRLIHQEIETRGRSLGDHGIRHVATNCKSSLEMLNELQGSGIKITGKQKLMAIATMVDHDIGYTVGEAGTSSAKGGTHKQNSKDLSDQEPERMDNLFGKEDGTKIRDMILTHDDPELDWEKDPVTSAVRLADNTSLFGKEKVQDLFLRSPKATALACKLRLAAEAKPDDKALQEDIKKQMHEVIEGDEFEDGDRELLHAQVNEMNEDKYSTTIDILSRFSGKMEGFKFDSAKKMMNVNMRYSSEGQMVDQLFGDAVACRQFDKMAKDLGGAPVRGKRGNTQFKNKAGQVVFQLNIDGFEEQDDPTTSAMRDFAEKTARTELRHASMLMYPPPDASEKDKAKAIKALEPAKKKFSKEEWKQLMEAFEEGGTAPGDLAKKLGMWPLLQSEFSFLSSKTASQRLACHVMISVLGDRVASHFLAARGQQTQRKDKDLMQDTGGISKNRQRSPDLKPPRTDSHNRYRIKDKTPDQRDPDVDRKAKTASCAEVHPLDREVQGAFCMMPDDNYHRQVWSKLVEILADIQKVSEKDFTGRDHLHTVADKMIRSSEGEELIQTFIGVGARPEMCAEGMYFEMIGKGQKASVGFESVARSALASLPRTLREAVYRR